MKNRKRYFIVFFDGSHCGSMCYVTNGSYVNRRQMVLEYQNRVQGFEGTVSNIVELSKSDFEDFTKETEK